MRISSGGHGVVAPSRGNRFESGPAFPWCGHTRDYLRVPLAVPGVSHLHHRGHLDMVDVMSDQTPASETDNRIRFQLKLPRDLHRRLKVASAVTGESMNDMLVRAAEDILRPVPARQESP